MAEHNKRRPLHWMRLDNAALIFPASMRRRWSNAYRISFNFTEEVDPVILQEALSRIAPRFPSVVVRVCRSFFWYYLEEVENAPAVKPDSYIPLVRMNRHDIRECAIRVLYYENRMAVEYFHSVTDGTGALVFAKNLAAEYLRRRYLISIPNTCGLMDLNEEPHPDELEDSFRRYVGNIPAPRDSLNVFRPKGTWEPDGYLHLVNGIVPTDILREKSKSHGVSVTGYLTGMLLYSLIDLQKATVQPSQYKPIKVQIPVNLRKLFPSKTMRNFVAVVNIGIDPRMGEYTLPEIMKLVYHQMQLYVTPKNMQAIFTPNVQSEMNPLIKIVPRFIKNIIMRIVFDTVGERVSSTCLSNLGRVELPDEMAPYVERVEFTLSPPSSTPYNISITSWKNETYINLVHNIRETDLERLFYTNLVKDGLPVHIQSNQR